MRRLTRGNDRGIAAVELAVLLPLLLLITFGVIDFGRALSEQVTITNAARAGARVSAMGGSLATSLQTTLDATPGLHHTYVFINDCPQPWEREGKSASVSVTQPFTFITPLGAISKLFGGLGLPSTLTLTATAVMPCET